jgi:Transposase, Mutator family
MTVTKIRTDASAVKELLRSDKEFLKPLIQAALQEVLEAEMTEAVGAGNGERTEGRLGYRSGYYGRSLITVSASSSCGFPRTEGDGSRRNCSSATPARRRRSLRRWRRCMCKASRRRPWPMISNP